MASCGRRQRSARASWRCSSAWQSKRLIIAVSPVQVRPPLRSTSPLCGYDWPRAKLVRWQQTEPRGRHLAVAKATDIRPKITLACVECKERNYITRKNRRNDPDRLELKKFCPRDGRHTVHRETR